MNYVLLFLIKLLRIFYSIYWSGLMKVAKFGGSSLANANQFKKVGRIIQEDGDRKIIVVSAPGKHSDSSLKMTDLLIMIGEASRNYKPYNQFTQMVQEQFQEIIEGLGLQNGLVEEIIQSIERVIQSDLPSERKLDAIKALGEDWSARILSQYLSLNGLNAMYMNPKDAGIIVSNEAGNAQLLPESMERIFALREKSQIIVIPGFFGYTLDGTLATFSRGGSDITGAILAAGVKASLYENFTDVDSVYAVNPTIVQNPKEIQVLTYKEMRELSYAGFSVFHDEALIPAFRAGIPVAIKNTNNPKAAGTRIVAEKEAKNIGVVGIASDDGFSSLFVSKYLMNREVGFGRKLLHILEDEDISFEHVPSGIDDLSVILRENQLTPSKEQFIIEKIKEQLQPETVTIQRNLAMIMIVGEGMMRTIGIAQKATKAFKDANVNIVMINQGSSDVSMMFGIDANDLEKAIQSLYKVFFD